jgi:hypothetical protein
LQSYKKYIENAVFISINNPKKCMFFLFFLGLRWTVNTHCECVFLRSLLDGLLACRLLAPKECFRLKNTHCEWVFFIKKQRWRFSQTTIPHHNKRD